MTTIDLRTDSRAAELWRRTSPRVEAMAELLEDEVPNLPDTQYAALWRHQMQGSRNCKGCNDRWIERVTARKLALARSIRDDGFREGTGPSILVRDRDGRLEFLDGTHRACCLLVLGERVTAQLQEPLPTFDPLERYPMRD